MTVTEKTAYLKGLLDGLKIDRDTDEGKLLAALVETVDEIAQAVSDLECDAADMAEVIEQMEDDLDDIDEELEEMEDAIDTIVEVLEDCCECEDDDDDDDDCDCCCDEDDEDDEELDGVFYQLVCPTCSEEICIEEDTLEKGSMKCPACGEELEFDLSMLEEDEDCCCDDECDCGCEH